MNHTTLDTLVQTISRLADKRIPADDADFMVYDYAGSNVDDAYEQGERAGGVLFARELMKIINPPSAQ